MKNRTLLLTALCLLATSLAALSGPVGKGGTIIKKPGKYNLIRDIAVAPAPGFTNPVGIVIACNGVELDLAGYAIGPNPAQPGAGIGIFLSKNVRQVRVQNGRIQQIDNGVRSENFQYIHECIFERLHIASCTGDFLVIRGSANVVRHCTMTYVPGGHQAIVVHGLFNLGNEVSDCSIMHGGEVGISAGQAGGLFIRRCYVADFEYGFYVNSDCQLMDNVTRNCDQPIDGNPVLLGINK